MIEIYYCDESGSLLCLANGCRLFQPDNFTLQYYTGEGADVFMPTVRLVDNNFMPEWDNPVDPERECGDELEQLHYCNQNALDNDKIIQQYREKYNRSEID